MNRYTALRPLMASVLALSFPLVGAFAAELSADLKAAMEKDEPIRVLIVAKQSDEPVVSVMNADPLSRRRAAADRATASIRRRLAEAGDGFGFGDGSRMPSAYLWAANAVAADVDGSTLEALAEDPSVDRIVMDRVLPVLFDDPQPVDAQAEDIPEDPLWHLRKVGTVDVRQKGFTGQGVRVGVIDTGIQADHPELEGKVEKFLDFTTLSVEDGELVGTPGTEPYDDNGHGTHCAGTIAGNKVGIAPDAKLIIAKSMGGEGGGSIVGLLVGMQWMLDPDGDPSTNDQPDIVSNSWGINIQHLGEDINLFRQLVVSWREAGIVPIFAAGNDGPETAAAPAIYPESFAVGATTHHDTIAPFSTGIKVELDGGLLIKPDISAPGAAIVSSYPGSKYARLDGTSMACPLVAGAVALAKGAFPGATIDQLTNAFEKGALELGAAGKDDRFGHGRLDVPAAFARLGQIFGAPQAD
jgi:subtilisin family serine protease